MAERDKAVGGTPRAWMFHAVSPGNERPEWVRTLAPGKIFFWWHGRFDRGGGGGAPFTRQFARGDSVVMLVGAEIVGFGVLVFGSDLRFVDGEGRRRWPIMMSQVLREPIPRSLVEKEPHRQTGVRGAARPLSDDFLNTLNSVLGTSDTGLPTLPMERGPADELLSAGEMVVDALRERGKALGNILPDEETAHAIDWGGEIWRPGQVGVNGGNDGRGGDVGGSDDGGSEDGGSDHGSSVDEHESSFALISDAPSDGEDRLDRGPYALFLGRRLHLTWCRLNGCAPGADAPKPASRPGAADSNTFIVHVDAPWGGGKTTFANFIARVLDPGSERLSERHFLRTSLPEHAAGASLADIFVPKFAKDEPGRFAEARLPWIIARYNAWRDQNVQPPWWQIFHTIQLSTREALWHEGAYWRWFQVHLAVLGYKLGNSKLRGQFLLWLLFGAALLVLIWTGWLQQVLTGSNGGLENAAKVVGALVTILGFGGISVATFLNAVGQSLNPDLDFTAEAKQVGVLDPITRFRAMFDRLLRLARRPVLLIVDDIDRCDPGTVVEVMRGFQTIVRSSRLFVLLLGDRAWIEAAHDLHYKNLAALAEAEAGLGSLFVRKVIQLSFRLPLMSETVRSNYTRYILGADAPAQKGDELKEILRQAEGELAGVEATGSVAGRERKTASIVQTARDKMDKIKGSDLSDGAGLLDRIVGIREVVAASEDAEREKDISSALGDLFAGLPNNPRQMKRVVMAFGIYENVGRIYFGYRRTATGPDGALKARRWRQLALWVTLATEWPETWRAIARRPDLTAAAFGDAAPRGDAEAAIAALPEAERLAAQRIVQRLRSDPALRALLSGVGADAAMEVDAIYEFNRIIWEPGFKLQDASELATEPPSPAKHEVDSADPGSLSDAPGRSRP